MASKHRTITSDYTADVCAGVRILQEHKLCSRGHEYRILHESHIRSIAHVMTFSVRHCMILVHVQICTYRWPILGPLTVEG